MLNYPGQAPIYLYAGVCDMRKSFDGLLGLIQQAEIDDPLSGAWFVFRNRQGHHHSECPRISNFSKLQRFGETADCKHSGASEAGALVPAAPGLISRSRAMSHVTDDWGPPQPLRPTGPRYR